MTFWVLDPTHETIVKEFAAAPRLKALEGRVVGFISNGKEGTVRLFDHLEHLLRTEAGVARVVRLVKSNYSAPAEPELIAQASDWDAVITGVGD